MQVLKIWDEKDYDPRWRRFIRKAARAVIMSDNGKIALVKSRKEGFYKFPGGGIKRGESHVDALIRETREEAGLKIIPKSIKELGMFWEIRKSVYDREIFDQRSYYYLAKAEARRFSPRLEPYERSLGFRLEFVDVAEAYETNSHTKDILSNNFIRRETCVLKELMDRGAALKETK